MAAWSRQRLAANAKPDLDALRRRAFLHTGIGLGAGVCLYALGRPVLAAVAAGIALTSLLLALVSPTGGYRRWQAGVQGLAHAVGTVLAWVVLLPAYLLFFVPFGALFRRGQRDPLKRFTDPQASSYWVDRQDDGSSPERHARPY